MEDERLLDVQFSGLLHFCAGQQKDREEKDSPHYVVTTYCRSASSEGRQTKSLMKIPSLHQRLGISEKDSDRAWGGAGDKAEM